MQAASSRGSTLPVIMLTGLQDSMYTHQNVAQLVWQYFPKPGIQTLYYNIVVLPLQRRVSGTNDRVSTVITMMGFICLILPF